MKRINYLIIMVAVLFTACQKDPSAGIKSHERDIESFSVGTGFTQVGPATVNQDSSKVYVRILMQGAVDFSKVTPTVITSYKSTVSPASGTVVNFASGNNQVTYTVTAQTGQTRTWTVVLQP